jgi:hypothetical protein
MRRRVEVGFVTVVMADFLSVCWQQLQQAAARLNAMCAVMGGGTTLLRWIQ